MGVSDATFRKFHLRFCVPQEEDKNAIYPLGQLLGTVRLERTS